ncbi:hypothetical protein EHM76_07300 [bacterium]|nr:MAG: hypothetical protein EHM76_07300 [bacterium]
MMGLLLGAALVVGLLMLCIKLVRLFTDEPEAWVAIALVYGGFAVGLIVPPVAILWMAFA